MDILKYFNPVYIYVIKTIAVVCYQLYLIPATFHSATTCGLWTFQIARFLQKLPLILNLFYSIKILEFYSSFVLIISMFLNLILMANMDTFQSNCPQNLITLTNIEYYIFLITIISVLMLLFLVQVRYSLSKVDRYGYYAQNNWYKELKKELKIDLSTCIYDPDNTAMKIETVVYVMKNLKKVIYFIIYHVNIRIIKIV